MDVDDSPSRRERLKVLAGIRIAILRMEPAQLVLLGYVSYMAIGWALLCLPVSQAVPVPAIDALFIAVSAVSTTGLVSVDPGGSFTAFGEGVILALIQLGGIGYMTVSSFMLLAALDRLGPIRTKVTAAAFSLPKDMSRRNFLQSVVVFTLACEVVGVLVLWRFFAAAGVENPLWQGIFHSVSAFSTAGFSLFPNSLEDFRGHAGVTLTISALSILGAIGFLVVADMRQTLLGKTRHLAFTCKVILRMTLILLVVGTTLVLTVDPTIRALPLDEQLLAAFFQAMTASTTVGFNTHPVSAMSQAAILVLMVLMLIGASPSGTGGGLKTTTFAVLAGLVRSTLKQRDRVRFFKRRIPLVRLQTAAAALIFYGVMLVTGLFFLFLTDPGLPFEMLVFEAMSALGTVGLSLGITGELSDPGKLVVIVLMLAGRVGILSFGIAIASHDESREEERDRDILV